MAILVVPLLLERGGRATRVDRVLVVDCPEDEQVRRVDGAAGLTDDEVRAIMASAAAARRAARAGRRRSSTTPGRVTAIAPQVAALDQRYRELAAHGARGAR